MQYTLQVQNPDDSWVDVDHSHKIEAFDTFVKDVVNYRVVVVNYRVVIVLK